MGSSVYEGVGLICLGPKSVTLNKKMRSRKGKTKRREEGERIYIYIYIYISQQADLTSFVVQSSWNLEKMFETRVATIWTVEIRF